MTPACWHPFHSQCKCEPPEPLPQRQRMMRDTLCRPRLCPQVARLRCHGKPAANMRLLEAQLEAATGGVVVHRTGGTLLVYRGDGWQPRAAAAPAADGGGTAAGGTAAGGTAAGGAAEAGTAGITQKV